MSLEFGYQDQNSEDPGITAKAEKKVEYQDNTDRIEVERTFCVNKRRYGMDQIATKFEETYIYRIICIRTDSFQDSEANTFCPF
jgi:hypothetical protein